MNTAVLIVATIMTALVLMRLIEARQKRQISLPLEQQLAAQRQAIDQLQERVAVLEAIVTDRSFNLRQEIDALPH